MRFQLLLQCDYNVTKTTWSLVPYSFLVVLFYKMPHMPHFGTIRNTFLEGSQSSSVRANAFLPT